MGSTNPVTASDPHRFSAWEVALGLDVVGVVCVVISVSLREAAQTVGMPQSSMSGVFAGIGLICIVSAGGVAARSLWSDRLATPVGRSAMRAALLNMLFLPAMKPVEWVAEVVGGNFKVSWGMPFFAIWLAAAVAAIALAALDFRERSKAVLVVPLIFAAAALTFFLGDLI